LPSTIAVVVPPGMNENAPEFSYQLIPSAVSKFPWQAAFTALANGFLTSEILEGMFDNIPHLVAWKGDNVETEFDFHADRPAISTAKIHGVWVNGAPDAAAVLATTKVTPSVKPGDGDLVVCLYEYAA
jgi:hypothetical protein